jgi:ribosomal protein S25
MPPWLEKIKKGDKDEEDKKAKEKKKASDNSADPAVLDTAEVVEEVNLSVGGEVESEITSTRAALVDFVSSRLGRKNK